MRRMPRFELYILQDVLFICIDYGFSAFYCLACKLVSPFNWTSLYKQGLNKWKEKALLPWCSWLSFNKKTKQRMNTELYLSSEDREWLQCLRYGGRVGPCIWNHVIRCSQLIICVNQLTLPRDPVIRRGRSPFQTGSKLTSIPTIQRLSRDASEMTSHWFLMSESQNIGCPTLMAEVIMTDVRLWPVDFYGQTSLDTSVITSHLNGKDGAYRPPVMPLRWDTAQNNELFHWTLKCVLVLTVN